MSQPAIVIIGASHAGISCAEKLRQFGYQGSLIMLDRIADMPYQRPPLSKTYLSAGKDAEDGFYLRPKEWFDSQNITLITGVEVTSVNPAERQIITHDGQTFDYSKLILATGAAPRRLKDEIHQLEGVKYLRTVEDARQIKSLLKNGMNGKKIRSVAIIGGGYIGLEIAASLRKENVDVHLVEMADRVLARVASTPLSRYCEALHQQHGVTVVTQDGLADIISDAGQLSAVSLSSGHRISAQLMIVGIGVYPETSLAGDAGLMIDNGVVVSADYASANPDMYAIGDVARAPEHAPIRVESVHHAQFSAMRAAAHICDAQPAKTEAWWFWSDQYDVKFQMAGLLPASDQGLVHITRKGRKADSLSVWSFHHGQLVCVEAANDAQAYMIGKFCLENQVNPDPADLENDDFELKSLMKR